VNNLLPILYILGLYSAFVAGVILLRNRLSVPRSNTREFHFPRTTLLLLLAVAVPSALQLFFPVVLSLFERDYERFLSGDWWRLVTPLFVQDGGIAGTIFNLVSLLLVGSVAERLWGGRYMLIIFFIGGIIGEIVAFTWQPVGAGNSIGNFSLAASIAMASLTRHPSRSIQIGAVFALGADGLLVGLQDIHGAAAIVGAILGLILSQLWHGKD
jgi:membrane associated rhomboid family serine protease